MTGRRDTREHSEDAAQIQHRGVAGNAPTPDREQVPPTKQAPWTPSDRQIAQLSRLQKVTISPTTRAASATLNAGHQPRAMKSTTDPRASRSLRLPVAPPRTNPNPTAVPPTGAVDPSKSADPRNPTPASSAAAPPAGRPKMPAVWLCVRRTPPPARSP